MKKYSIYVFWIAIFLVMQTASAYTPDDSCNMRYWVSWLMDINWECKCVKPWYTQRYGEGILSCHLDSQSCVSSYGSNSVMKANWVCGCVANYTLFTDAITKKQQCVSVANACKDTFWIFAIGWSLWDTPQCWCKEGYKFSNGGLTNHGMVYIDLYSNTYSQCVSESGLSPSADSTTTLPATNTNTTYDDLNLGDVLANLNDEYILSANKLAYRWIINDHSNDNNAYNLDKTITRREMLKIMMNLSKKWIATECKWIFKDLKKSDWWCVYAESALNNGFIAKNSYFRPDDNVSKVEAIKMIFQATDIAVSSTDDWRVGYVEKWAELGLFDAITDYDTKAIRWFIFSIASKVVLDMEAKNNKEETLDDLLPR